jgi:hypothetical protein
MTLGDGILMTVTIQAEDNLMILMTLVKVLWWPWFRWITTLWLPLWWQWWPLGWHWWSLTMHRTSRE